MIALRHFVRCARPGWCPMEVFRCAKEASWGGIAAAAAAWTLALFAVNAVGFRGAAGAFLRELQAVTGGLVEPTLVGSAAVLFLFMLAVVAIGRVPLASVGWTRHAAARAFLPVIGFWLLMQATLALLAVAGGDGIMLHPSWRDAGAGAVVGGLLGQVFGNALAEETAFRGFFFTQILLKVRSLRPAAAVGVALSASALLFALSHLPNRLFVKELPIDRLVLDQARLVLAGVLFALVFVVTRNVFTVAGLHALANDPVPLVAATADVVSVTYVALLALLVPGWWIVQRFTRPGRRPEEP